MTKWKCVTKCYVRGRLYELDEVVEALEPPSKAHFVDTTPLQKTAVKAPEFQKMSLEALKKYAQGKKIEIPAAMSKAEDIAAFIKSKAESDK